VLGIALHYIRIYTLSVIVFCNVCSGRSIIPVAATSCITKRCWVHVC